MSSAFTLRAAAGLPTTPASIAACTLLVIDAQREYLDGRVVLDGVQEAVGHIARLLEAARSAGAPVVHVAHQGKAGALFDPDAGGRIIDAVAPVGSETVVGKKFPNAFAHTDLAVQLPAERPLVIVGFMTHMCVSATARAALDHGLETIVASDATATRALPSATGPGDLDAATVHAAALAELADRFSVVATTAEILRA